MKDTHSLKVEGWEKIFHTDGNKEMAGVQYLSNKIDCETKSIVRQRTLHNDKGSNPTRDYTLLTFMYPP